MSSSAPTRDPGGSPPNEAGQPTLGDELALSAEQVEAIIAIAPDAVITVDDQQRIRVFNEGAERIFGYGRAEAIGQPLDLLIPEPHRAAHRAHIEKFGAGTEHARRIGERRAQIRGRRKSGEVFPAEAAISYLERDGVRFFTVLLRDVTEVQRIEAEHRFLATFGEALAGTLEMEEAIATVGRFTNRFFSDCCVMDLFDEHGRLSRMSVAHRDPARTALVEALRNTHVDLKRPHLSRFVVNAKRATLIEDVSDEYLQLIAHDEEELRVLRELSPRSLIGIPLRAPRRCLGIMILVSSEPGRRYGERELRLAEDVAHRAALAIENARLYREARRAIHARDEVLGIVAHDLRNPLNAIQLAAGMLTRQLHDEQQRKAVRSSLNTITRSSQMAAWLIEDLLDVTRMDAGKLVVERDSHPAHELAKHAAETLEPIVASSSKRFEVVVPDGLPAVWADHRRVFQVLENLVLNAVKFTGADGRIVLRVQSEGPEVRFTVEDNGHGISADHLSHLFVRYWQANTKDRRGTGLGLLICKGIVDMHGGRIWAESTVGVGTCFHFTLPCAPKGRAAGAEPSNPEREPAPEGEDDDCRMRH